LVLKERNLTVHLTALLACPGYLNFFRKSILNTGVCYLLAKKRHFS
jgi:hypothetical protein